MSALRYAVSQKRAASGLFIENACMASRACLLAHSVVLDQPKLPILRVCLYQTVKFSPALKAVNCTVECSGRKR